MLWRQIAEIGNLTSWSQMTLTSKKVTSGQGPPPAEGRCRNYIGPAARGLIHGSGWPHASNPIWCQCKFTLVTIVARASCHVLARALVTRGNENVSLATTSQQLSCLCPNSLRDLGLRPSEKSVVGCPGTCAAHMIILSLGTTGPIELKTLCLVIDPTKYKSSTSKVKDSDRSARADLAECFEGAE